MKNSIVIKTAMLMAVTIFLFSACSDSSSGAAETYPKMDVAALDKLLTNNKGKPVVLCFWTTWCPACRQEIPELGKLSKEYGDRIEVAAVSLDEKKEALNKFFKDGAPEVDVYMGDNQVASRYKVTSIPHMVMYDRGGEVIFSQPGVFPHDMLTAAIEKLLEQ